MFERLPEQGSSDDLAQPSKISNIADTAAGGTDQPVRAEAAEADALVAEADVALDATAKLREQRAAIRRDGRKPKAVLENPTPKGGRGHFSKQIKSQLSHSGKLNATPPMSAEQKRLRRRKRKK